MKKFFTVLTGAILLASATSAFAEDPNNSINCPSPSIIRDRGSVFTTAYLADGYDWTLIGQAFEYDDQQWQTTFTITLPNVMSSSEALEDGARNFAHTPLATAPAGIHTPYKTECIYTPSKLGVRVTVSTPVEWGFKKS